LKLAGNAGWGEATIPPYYHIDPSSMISFWQAAARREDPLPDDPAEIESWIGTQGPAPARCALDLALHDRIGRQWDIPLYEVLNVPQPKPAPTAFTISIDEPEKMAWQASQITAYPVIKVKLGSDDDAARLAAIRAARPDVTLYVDANAAWSPQMAVSQLHKLLPFGLALVEQPVPKDDIEGMGYVQARLNVPVVADESVQTLDDVERLARAGVRGINIKLMKVGGLSPALRLIRRARDRGLQIMLGCMVETSLGVTAMSHLAGLADWLDLDAPLLIGNDPFDGLRYDNEARIHLADRPGIGVVLR
jgi:L-alanine-DL-glutamate epimerase-like enolase superfamily enzyme